MAETRLRGGSVPQGIKPSPAVPDAHKMKENYF